MSKLRAIKDVGYQIKKGRRYEITRKKKDITVILNGLGEEHELTPEFLKKNFEPVK